ncbi:hypothetical protein IWQ62_006867 [Dispira parvispora]|uniref:Uncharacterized protein n=1 Tax=Dispira parvispora TaxID=1520584 RepID=A0A9W8AM72_9FUNG|nr:hypothetical protein IWQ62_006867 [Dispira parvispora]
MALLSLLEWLFPHGVLFKVLVRDSSQAKDNSPAEVKGNSLDEDKDKVKGSSLVVVKGNSPVGVKGSSPVEVKDNFLDKARDSSQARAKGNSQVKVDSHPWTAPCERHSFTEGLSDVNEFSPSGALIDPMSFSLVEDRELLARLRERYIWGDNLYPYRYTGARFVEDALMDNNRAYAAALNEHGFRSSLCITLL